MNHELLTMNNELRTTNYQLNTSDERQATCDKFAPFWSYFVAFCAFCASLRLIMHLFSRLQIKVRPKGLHNFAFYILIFNFPPCPSCSSWLKNPFNQRNPRLINDLRSTKAYVRKNNLFMQNKANFQKVKLNVNEVLTKDYVQLDTWSIRKTKPIQSQLKPIQTQLKPIKCQSKPIQSQFKPNLKPISPAHKTTYDIPHTTYEIQTQFHQEVSPLGLPPHFDVKAALNLTGRGFLKFVYSYFQAMRGNLLVTGQLLTLLLAFLDILPEELFENLRLSH